MTIDESVQQMLADDRSASRLGIEVTHAHAGTALARQVVTEDMANGLGIAQGGFVFALADQAFACAANSVAAGTATVDASISFLSPAHIRDELAAEARVTYSDHRRVVVDVVVRVGDRVVALFRGTGRTLRPTSP